MNKKILILGTSDFGGVTVYVSSLIKRIEEFDFFIPVAEMADTKKIKSLFPCAHLIKLNQIYSISSIWKTINSINRLIKSNDIHLIHSHTLLAGFLAALYKFLFNPNIKLIYTGHGLRYTQKIRWFSKIGFKYIECFTNKLSNNVIFIRKFDYDVALKEKIVSTSKSSFIRTQLDSTIKVQDTIDIRSKYQIKSKYIIANAASIYDLKNPDLFISIASLVLKKRDDVCFVWFGDGTTRSKIIERLEEKNLEKKIKFVGALDKTLMNDVFKQLDGLLLTSKVETFPLVVLEAYLTNTLVFSSNFKGNDEIIINNKTGFVFDLVNPQEAANSIIGTISDTKIKHQILAEAYAFFNVNFNNIDNFANLHANLYRNLLK